MSVKYRTRNSKPYSFIFFENKRKTFRKDKVYSPWESICNAIFKESQNCKLRFLNEWKKKCYKVILNSYIQIAEPGLIGNRPSVDCRSRFFTRLCATPTFLASTLKEGKLHHHFHYISCLGMLISKAQVWFWIISRVQVRQTIVFSVLVSILVDP